jgi:hypothetical protein
MYEAQNQPIHSQTKAWIRKFLYAGNRENRVWLKLTDTIFFLLLFWDGDFVYYLTLQGSMMIWKVAVIQSSGK